MKLHANAALSLKGRRLLVDRVVEQGWSLTQAAEAAGVSDRTCASGWPATAPRASTGCWIAPRRRSRSRNRTDERRVEVIAALRRLRFTGAEIAELLGDGALDGLGDPDADRDGQARPARAGARRCATSARAPAS